MSEARCAVGLGGEIPEMPWRITWLPRGYAITAEDRVVCAFAEPEDGSWEQYGLRRGERPPLVEAVCLAIEAFYRTNPNAPPPGRLESYAAAITDARSTA